MTRPDNIIHIPKYSGSKPVSAAGGTRHPTRLSQESPRSPLPTRGDSQLHRWLLIFGLVLACMIIAGL